MDQLTIDGILYDILRDESREEITTTRPDTAAVMAQVGALRVLILRKPRGKKTFWTYDHGPHPYKKRYRILG